MLTFFLFLQDFRNFTYSLPIIRGMVIHMEDKLTTVLIPQNNYAQIQKALQNSNDPVLALGGNFSPSADSHLVAVQRDEDEPSRNALNNSDYETQAINIQNKARKGWTRLKITSINFETTSFHFISFHFISFFQ
jgi:MAD (mothers against decapentaplegic) interacting protein